MKILMSGVIVGLLTACGGGGESTAPAVNAPPVTALPVTVPPESQTPVSAPPLAAQAVTFASPTLNLKTDSTYILMKYSGKSTLALVGNGNNVWISEGQVMDSISITGTSNTMVMMAGSSVISLVVSAGNTVYLPLGSSIAVGGTGATVKYYAK